MKKQLLFCSLALASSMTAFAGVGDPVTDLNKLSNNTYYTITPQDNARGTWYYNASDPTHLYSTGKLEVEVNTADPAQQFAFLKSASGRYYVYSVGAQKFLQYSADGFCVLVDAPESSDATATFVRSTGGSQYPWVVALGNNHHVGISNGYNYGVITSYNDTNDGGNCITIKEGSAFDSKAALDKINQYEANVYLSIPDDAVGAVGSYDATLWNALNNVCGGDKNASAEDVEKPGFAEALENLQKAPLVAFSNDKVYTIKHDHTHGLLCAMPDDDKIYTKAEGAEGIVANSDKWQVYQDADGRYHLYNQGLKSYAQYEDGNWTLTDEQHEVTIGAASMANHPFTLFIADGDHNMFAAGLDHNMTSYGGGLGTNDGSCFYFTETEGKADDIGLPIAREQAQQMIEGYDADHLDCVGAYKTGGIQHLQEVLGKSDVTTAELNAAMNAVETVEPQADKYYWIKNLMAFNDGQAKSIFANPDGSNIAWDSFGGSAAELWQLEVQDNNDYWIKNVNSGKYVQLNNGFKLGDGTGADMQLNVCDKPYNIGLRTTVGSDYTMSLSQEDGLYNAAGANAVSGGYVSSYNNYDPIYPTQWNIVEATSVNLEIGATGYATAYFPFAVTIPEGVKAYAVTAAAVGVATLSPLTGTIPARTGVILSGAAKTYPFAITTSAASEVEGNLLHGVTMATDLDPETSYILANGTNGLGFYKVDSNDKTLAANKAYLVVSNAADASYSLKLDGAVTGIQSVENAAENAPAYDLQGRRLPQVPTKGLYIQNGKKIMK